MQPQNNYYRSTTTLFVLCLLAIIGLLLVDPVMLRGKKYIELAKAPPLSGLVSQTMISQDGNIPAINRDFRFKNRAFFHNQDWVVIYLEALNETANDGMIVMKKVNGAYQTVLGPGSAFPNSLIMEFPDDVAKYIRQAGVVYDEVN